MGIYIPNMDKPEFCDNCPLWNEDRLVCGYITKVSRIFKCPIIDIVTCGECEYADEYNHCKYSAWWNGNADFCSHGIRRKEKR